MALGEAGEVLDVVLHALAGWRYLLSPSFRRETHARWREEGWVSAGFDVLGGVIGVAAVLVVLWFVIAAV